MVRQMKARYEAYTQDVAKVYKDARPMDGLFGWGDDPRRDPCHMRFYEDLEQWVKHFLSAAPGQEEVYEAVRFMLETPAEHRDGPCFWFMFAAQGLTRELIPLLSAAQCGALRDSYDDRYPRRDRMPVQKEVYKSLKKGAGRR
nr:hypothetical protein [Oscillospiraceae bacterium]